MCPANTRSPSTNDDRIIFQHLDFVFDGLNVQGGLVRYDFGSQDFFTGTDAVTSRAFLVGLDLNPFFVATGRVTIGCSTCGGFETLLFTDVIADIRVVPIPATAWLFGSALAGLIGLGNRRKTA